MGFNNEYATAQKMRAISTTQKHRLGFRAKDTQGKTFRYVKAGGTTLIPGTLLQSPALEANHAGMSCNAAVLAGGTVVTLVLGDAAVTADQYRGGSLVVTSNAGIGYAYTINGHAAQTNATGILSVNLDEPVVEALSLNSKLDLVPNPYSAVIIQPASKTGVCVGVAISAIVNAQYGWIQTSGPAPVKMSGTPAAGDPISISANTAGFGQPAVVAAQAANTATTLVVVGNAQQTGVAANCKIVVLTIE